MFVIGKFSNFINSNVLTLFKGFSLSQVNSFDSKTAQVALNQLNINLFHNNSGNDGLLEEI